MGTYFRLPKVLLTKYNGRQIISTFAKNVKPRYETFGNKIIRVIGANGKVATNVLLDVIMGKRKDTNGHVRILNKHNYLKRKLAKLETLKFVSIIDGVATLTTAGKIELEKLVLKSNQTKKIKWDGKWRFVIFDIWERRRHVRSLLRRELVQYGFILVQRSVWVYPYDCRDFVTLLKTDLKLGKGILFLVVEELEDDFWLRKLFNL
ncbi:MAG TPA: hypothetical protein VJI73_02545 [Candidatus Paceibacterota bacterium]